LVSTIALRGEVYANFCTQYAPGCLPVLTFNLSDLTVIPNQMPLLDFLWELSAEDEIQEGEMF